jgi:hypothetical protein
MHVAPIDVWRIAIVTTQSKRRTVVISTMRPKYLQDCSVRPAKAFDSLFCWEQMTITAVKGMDLMLKQTITIPWQLMVTKLMPCKTLVELYPRTVL